MYNKLEMALRQAAKNIKRKESGNGPSLPIIAMVIAIAFFAWQNISLFGKNGVLSKKDQQISRDLQREMEKNKSLKEEQARLSSRDYEEQLIREKAMYKRSGEKIIHVSGLGKNASSSTSTAKTEQKGDFNLAASMWEDFKKIFLK